MNVEQLNAWGAYFTAKAGKEKVKSGWACESCNGIQVVTAEGSYLIGNDLDVVVIGTVNMCVLCDLIGTPEKVDA